MRGREKERDKKKDREREQEKEQESVRQRERGKLKERDRKKEKYMGYTVHYVHTRYRGLDLNYWTMFGMPAIRNQQ